jgi:hypothetical protein
VRLLHITGQRTGGGQRTGPTLYRVKHSDENKNFTAVMFIELRAGEEN